MLKLGGDGLLHSPQHGLPKRSAQCPLLPRMSGPTGQCIVTQTPAAGDPHSYKGPGSPFPGLLSFARILWSFSSSLPHQKHFGESTGLKDGHGSSCFPIVLDLLLEGPWGSPHLVLSTWAGVFAEQPVLLITAPNHQQLSPDPRRGAGHLLIHLLPASLFLPLIQRLQCASLSKMAS